MPHLKDLSLTHSQERVPYTEFLVDYCRDPSWAGEQRSCWVMLWETLGRRVGIVRV